MKKKRIELTAAICLIALIPPFSQVHAAPSQQESSTASSIPTLEDADRYFDATLFDIAIPIYERQLLILHANTKERSSARLNLARSYYLTGQYSKIPKTLEEVNTPSLGLNPKTQSLDFEALFLLGLSFNKLKMPEPAVNIFLRYLSFEPKRDRPLVTEAQFELGSAYFEMQKYKEAKKQFEEIPPQTTKKNIYHLAQFYLARIEAKENNFNQSEKILDTLSKEAVTDEAFPSALAFLQGEIYFTQDNWKAAIPWFKKALPEKNLDKADWAMDALYYLGNCYLNLANQSEISQDLFVANLQEAEKAFLKMQEMRPSDRSSLSLGQCYLSQSIHLKDEKAKERLEALLSDTRQFTTKEALHHSLILRAEAASTYTERKRFFKQLTDESNKESPYYANSWYLKGVNEFEEGQRESIKGDKPESKKHLEEAISDFAKSFDLNYPADKKLAALSLKYQVQAYYYTKSREGHLKALALLGKMLNQYRDTLFLELEDQGEIFFLQGLIAANLSEGEEGTLFFHIAENSLLHNLESYPKGQFYDESRRLLATLYYSRQDFDKAEKLFLEIHKKTPEAAFSGEALYFASNCSEKKGDNPSKSKSFRKKVFEQYPDSPLAAEAMFRYYDFADYLKGKEHAMLHLMQFMNRYPDSPYILNALYLKGLNELQEKKSPDGKIKKEINRELAIEYFTKLEIAFNTLQAKGLIPEETFEYFLTTLYRAKLDKGLLYLTLAEEAEVENRKEPLQHAELALRDIFFDFDNPEHPFANILLNSEPLLSIQEESSFHLARCYSMAEDDAAALKLLEKKIESYQMAKITRGYYLSKSLSEMGKIAAKQDNYNLAIQYFRASEDAAKGKILRTDELLGLWIDESLCCQHLNEMDEAMLILSRVINYDAVSQKRLEAMFLRAEIYEAQGRPELARKQLEACASKGGKWAIRAKEKLEKIYAYQ